MKNWCAADRNRPTGMQRLEAAVVARSTLGVCSVQDDLRVAD